MLDHANLTAPQKNRKASPYLGKRVPLISLIAAFKNERTNIERMLRSVARQSEPAIEVHLIDDGSTDQTDDIAAAFIKKDPRFSLIRNTDSQGPSARRNMGLEAARGRFVFFIDGDDELLPEALEALVALSLKAGSDVVRGMHMFVNGQGTRNINAFDQYHMPELHDVRYQNMPSLVFLYTSWNMLISRQLIEDHKLGFEEGLNLGEDRVFTQKLFSASRSISLTKKPTYLWHRDPSRKAHLSLSKSLASRMHSVCAYVDLFDDLENATQDHRYFAYAAMFWEIYANVIRTGIMQTRDWPGLASFADLMDRFRFPEALLYDPSVKGWSAKHQDACCRAYLAFRRSYSGSALY